MHEVHLVREIMEKMERQAAAKGARRIKRVKIRFNRLTSHSADHVRFSFNIIKQNSIMSKSATLDLTEVSPLVRCEVCGHEFEADELPAMCPLCDSVKVKAVNSTDMVLETFEIEH